MNKDTSIVELLHDLTQENVVITVSKDFNTMLTITYKHNVRVPIFEEFHEHIGIPYDKNLKGLEKEFVNLLAELLEEVK